jgi:hypothetical protein
VGVLWGTDSTGGVGEGARSEREPPLALRALAGPGETPFLADIPDFVLG